MRQIILPDSFGPLDLTEKKYAELRKEILYADAQERLYAIADEDGSINHDIISDNESEIISSFMELEEALLDDQKKQIMLRAIKENTERT